MAYSARLKAGIGAVRATLGALGIGMQGARFAEHGDHEPDADAPLVLVACSGGRDSMALAALSATVCATLGVRCGAVVVDHHMQTGSSGVARQAASRCRDLGLEPVCVCDVTVNPDGKGVEAAARDARYQALCEAACRMGAAAMLLAHTRDDQAETVLIGLLRSSGVDALAGMPRIFERGGARFARPLLDLSRDDTTGICEDLGIAWWDDPTNGDLAAVDRAGESPLMEGYPLRSRVRHRLIPFLERFAGGDVVTHLAEGTRQMQLDKAYLDGRAAEATREAVLDAGGDLLRLSADSLGREHPAIRRRVIVHALAAAGVAASNGQVADIERLVADWHGQGGVALPSGCTAFRQKHVIRVCQDSEHAYRRRSRSN